MVSKRSAPDSADLEKEIARKRKQRLKIAEEEAIEVFEPISRTDPRSYMASPMVTIKVEKNGQTRYAHKALLTTYCPYFQVCLKPTFLEGQSLVVDLRDDAVDSVDIFLSWIYSGNLTSEEPQLYNGCTGRTYVRLHILADKMLVTVLKDQIIDGLRRYIKKADLPIYPREISCIYSHDLLHTALGRFALRYFVWSLLCKAEDYLPDTYEGDDDRASNQLTALYSDPVAGEVLKAMCQWGRLKWQNPLWDDDCKYHEHGHDEVCMAQT